MNQEPIKNESAQDIKIAAKNNPKKNEDFQP